MDREMHQNTGKIDDGKHREEDEWELHFKIEVIQNY